MTILIGKKDVKNAAFLTVVVVELAIPERNQLVSLSVKAATDHAKRSSAGTLFDLFLHLINVTLLLETNQDFITWGSGPNICLCAKRCM